MASSAQALDTTLGGSPGLLSKERIIAKPGFNRLQKAFVLFHRPR